MAQPGVNQVTRFLAALSRASIVALFPVVATIEIHRETRLPKILAFPMVASGVVRLNAALKDASIVALFPVVATI